jgi:hypothetical protein
MMSVGRMFIACDNLSAPWRGIIIARGFLEAPVAARPALFERVRHLSLLPFEDEECRDGYRQT